MLHKSWTAREGAPQQIAKIIQARDGLIWIASDSGLYSFDGTTFSEFRPLAGEDPLPPGGIQDLFEDRTGALWVGAVAGGVARIVRHHVIRFDKADGQMLAGVRWLSQAPDGSVWGIERDHQLVRFQDNGSSHLEPLPVPGDLKAVAQYIDSHGSQWVAEAGWLYLRNSQQAPFRRLQIQSDIPVSISQAHDGTIWFTDVLGKKGKGRRQHIDQQGGSLGRQEITKDVLAAQLSAQDRSTWLALNGRGLEWVPRRKANGRDLSGARTFLAAKDGLSSSFISTIIQDSENNIWTAGSLGLDSFRPRQLSPTEGQERAAFWSACNMPDGQLWLTDGISTLKRLSSGNVNKELYSRGPYYLSCGEKGDLWFLDNSGVSVIRGGSVAQLPPIPGQAPYSFRNVLEISQGVVVVSGRIGLWQFSHRHWTRLSFGDIGAQAYALLKDQSGQIWIGGNEGRLVILAHDPGVIRKAFRLEVGRITALSSTRYGVLAAGLSGVVIVEESGQVRQIKASDPGLLYGGTGVTASSNGDVWVNASHGIVRIAAEEIQRAISIPDYAVKCKRISEGPYVGPASTFLRTPSAGTMMDGRVWFATTNGVVTLDPTEFNRPEALPTLSVEDPIVDGKPLPSDRKTPSQPHTLEIRYAGVHLSAPEEVVYRYQLVGVDATWQEVGSRREALYTNLRPGRYKFRISASSDGDNWTEPLSLSSFSVPPSFYQRTWFYLLCGASVLLAVLLVYRARVHLLEVRIRERADERANERLRIARDLHDTLLQSMQGLTLSFHAATQQLPQEAAVRVRLEQSLQRADTLLEEGRDRVSQLRSDSLRGGSLRDALEAAALEYAMTGNAYFRITERDSPRTLIPSVQAELFSIGREALRNAFSHSGARQIDLYLSFERKRFELSCSDDGRGMERTRPLTNHFGMQGMREATARLGGEFKVESSPGAGTVIRVTLPGRRAYLSQIGSRFLGQTGT